MSFSRSNPQKSLIGICVWLLWLAGLSGLIGCTDYLKGPKKNEDILVVENQEAKCLKDVPSQLFRFFNDQVTDSELKTGFSCAQKALKTFVRYTKGVSADQYTHRELQHFLNRYLLNENKISDDFMDELMKVKVLVVGGSLRDFTRVEIEQFSNYLDILAGQMRSLLGDMKLLLFKEKPELVNESRISQVQDKLRKVLENLIFESKLAVSAYEISDLRTFFSLFGEFTGSGKITNLIRWFPLAKVTKVLFWGEHTRVQSRSEWRDNIWWTSRAYGLALRYFFQDQAMPYSKPITWDKVIAFSDEVLNLIERSPVLRESGLFTLQHIDSFIDQLYEMKVLNISLSSEVFKNSYKKVIYHWLDQKPGDEADLRGLEIRHLAVLRFEYEVWRKAQVMINRAFQDQEKYSNKGILAYAEKNSSEFDRARNWGATAVYREELRAAWTAWLETFQHERVPTFNEDYKIIVTYDTKEVQQNFRGLTASNGIRMVVRLLMRGYGDQSHRDYFRRGMSEKRILDLEYNFREIGRAIGLLDPRNNDAAARTFKEGNFFTYSGNGDDKLDGQEAYELLHFMVSGGLVTTGHIVREAHQAECETNELDIRGRPKLKVSCVRQVFKDKFNLFFPALPGMQTFSQKLIKENNFDEFFDLLLQLSREKGYNSLLTENSEIRSLACLVHYIESLFVQFDKDQSQGLSKSEIFKAEPRFHGFIRNVHPGLSGGLVPEVFLYILATGKVPELRTNHWADFWQDVGYWSGYIRQRVLRDTRWNSVGEANRLQLLRVLGVFKTDGK